MQTLINHALREHIERRREPLETTLRRVIGEELRETDGLQALVKPRKPGAGRDSEVVR